MIFQILKANLTWNSSSSKSNYECLTSIYPTLKFSIKLEILKYQVQNSDWFLNQDESCDNKRIKYKVAA